MTIFAIRIHDRLTEHDPHLATIMRAELCEGPWHDMVSGEPDYCWDILGALETVEEQRSARKRKADARLREELDRARSLTPVNVDDG